MTTVRKLTFRVKGQQIYVQFSPPDVGEPLGYFIHFFIKAQIPLYLNPIDLLTVEADSRAAELYTQETEWIVKADRRFLECLDTYGRENLYVSVRPNLLLEGVALEGDALTKNLN